VRILWLNAGLLLPLDKGGKLRTWHLMRHLARRHSITYVCFADPNEKKEHREGMVEVCNSLVTVPRSDPAKGSTAFYMDAVRHVVNALPYAVGKYQSDEYAGRVQYLLQHGRFDVMVADFLPPVANLPKSIPVPAVLFTHNVEAEIWRRHAENASNPLSRILLKQQWHRMLRFEREALTRFDLVLGVSDTDRETFARLYPGALRRSVHVVQTGVDTAYFTPMPGQERPRHLVFTGSMDWLPNEDGMLYFVRDILPRIRATEPDVTLSIVGRTPTPAVERLAAENGIEVTGRVDDVRPHVAAAEVYIVPLRIGGGTRLKIFEAMSMAKAVVSTTIGAEGLPVTPGRDIVLADEPEAFADAVVQLIRDREKRQSIERAARDLVVQKYDWAAVSRDFEEALCAARGESHISRMSA
jgi:sugar transferase (PEP-CTERM/EpsH1 system associated)